MKKRLTALLLCVVLICALTACGEPASPPATQVPTTQPPATQTPENTPIETPDAPEAELGKVQLPLCEEVVDLSLFFMWDQGMAGNYVSSTADFDGFLWLEEQTNVHIEFIEVSNSVYKEQFNITLASNDLPDMMMRFANVYKAGIEHAIEEELILNITELMAEYAPNYKAVLDADEELRKSLVTDKGYMGVFYPIFSEKSPGPAQGVTIRQDWLDDLGMEVPVTFDDYEEVMEAFMTEKGAEFGIQIERYGSWPMNNLLNAWNIYGMSGGFSDKPFYAVDGEVKFAFSSNEYKEYLTMLHDWYNKGFISKDFVAWSSLNHMDRGNILYTPSITTGQVGIFNIMTSALKTYPDQCNEEDAKFTALPDPVLKEGDKIKTGKANTAARYENTGIAITTQCEEWEVAMKWLDWFYTEEGAIFNLCGLQGITWDYDENGEVWWTDMYLNPEEGVSTGNILYKYAVGTITWGLSMKNEMDRKVYNEIGDIAYGARLGWGQNLGYDYTIPFGVTMNADEGETWAKYFGDFQTYHQETVPRFITGEKSLDEFDEYVARMEELGSGELTEVVQSAYDRFMAK